MNTRINILRKQVSQLAKNYRSNWKEDLWESEKIEEYGFNEFIGGKAEAYEECLELIKDCIRKEDNP